jgi:hypothetical protein
MPGEMVNLQKVSAPKSKPEYKIQTVLDKLAFCAS